MEEPYANRSYSGRSHQMRFGTLSAIMLAIGGVTVLALFLLQPGWGDPRGILGGLLVMFSFPVSLMFGITGIIFDRPRWLAVISTALAGIPILLCLYVMVLNMMYRWRFSSYSFCINPALQFFDFSEKSFFLIFLPHYLFVFLHPQRPVLRAIRRYFGVNEKKLGVFSRISVDDGLHM